ncbi:MAG: LacI family transcriptional regulator [Chloroflexi bacterium]|nr:LacI family transcriptional regulator [Chloroflexota bacterium]
MTTIREVAKKAGVSPTSVSHVVNNTRFVSEDVRERVQAAMRELNYRPNALARSLRRGETHTLGLILPDSANPFFAEVGHAIESAAFLLGYSVILCNTDNDEVKEYLYTEVLENKQLDGIIFVGAGEDRESISELVKNGLPLVVVDRDMGNLGLDTVTTENYQGGYLATQHLLSLGHQIIGCITGPSNITPSADRVTGYRSALQQAGFPVEESLLVRGDFHAPSGHSAALQLLQLTPRPTAIFVCNDMMAIGALRAASQLGLRVPEDVAIIGFDDIELASYISPSLTTVAQPKLEMGQLAVKLLFERMGDPSLPPRHTVLATTLVVRESSMRS